MRGKDDLNCGSSKEKTDLKHIQQVEQGLGPAGNGYVGNVGT